MISSFEVAAIFRLKDEATAVFRRIAEEAQALNKELKALTDQGLKLSSSFAATFGKMDSGIASSIAEVRNLAAEWVAVERAAIGAAAAATRAGGVSAFGAGPRRRLGGGAPAPGIGFTPAGIPMPGGHAHVSGSDIAMGAAGVAAYAMDQESKLEDAIFKMAFHAGLPHTTENNNKFRDIIQSAASQTGFSYHDIAEAATNEIRLMKGAPGGGLEILPEMLRAAATESRLKDTGLKESMASIVEMAHMTKEYSPEQIKALAPLFGFLSTANPASLPQMGRAASYAMPTLQSALGMDPADVLFETTALARAGATNSKSGTWVRAAFERSLPPDPRVVGDKEYARRMFAMHKLGLVDANDKSTILDATGKHIDIEKLLNREREYASKLNIVERNAFEKKVFGEQGARGIDLLNSPAVLAQTDELKRLYPDFKAQYGTFMEDYNADSPVQKLRTTWQDLNKVLTDLGQTALPPVVQGLNEISKAFKVLDTVIPSSIMTPEKGSWADWFGKAGRSMALGGIGAGSVIQELFGLDKSADTAAKSVDTLAGSIRLLGGAAGGSDPTTPKKMNFIPPPKDQRPIILSSSLNIDGKTLAETISNEQVKAGEFSTQAAYADPLQSAWGPDAQTVGN